MTAASLPPGSPNPSPNWFTLFISRLKGLIRALGTTRHIEAIIKLVIYATFLVVFFGVTIAVIAGSISNPGSVVLLLGVDSAMFFAYLRFTTWHMGKNEEARRGWDS